MSKIFEISCLGDFCLLDPECKFFESCRELLGIKDDDESES